MSDSIIFQYSTLEEEHSFIKKKIKEKLGSNKQLYLENYPAPFESKYSIMMSNFLAVNSSFYRVIYASIVRCINFHYTTEKCRQFVDARDPENCIIHKLEDCYRFAADSVERRS